MTQQLSPVARAQHDVAPIDWADAKRQIGELGERLNRTETFTSEEAQVILDRRAQRLAEVVEPPRSTSESIETMVIGLAGERYAVETNAIREVLFPGSMTVLPGTSSHVAGLMNLRGHPLLIFDSRELFGLTAAELTDLARVLVIGVGNAEFGLLTESAEEVAKLDLSELLDPPQSLPAATRRFVRGVTSDAMIVLDTEILLNDPQLRIDESEE